MITTCLTIVTIAFLFRYLLPSSSTLPLPLLISAPLSHPCQKLLNPPADHTLTRVGAGHVQHCIWAWSRRDESLAGRGLVVGDHGHVLYVLLLQGGQARVQHGHGAQVPGLAHSLVHAATGDQDPSPGVHQQYLRREIQPGGEICVPYFLNYMGVLTH